MEGESPPSKVLRTSGIISAGTFALLSPFLQERQFQLESSERHAGVATMLKAGQSAPMFELPDADLNLVRLSDFWGTQNVVLYFYPKDDTLGCTMEAIDFSELQDKFAELDTVVIGVSRDDCFTHGAFRDKHGLSVYLLADTDAEVCEPYGVMLDREVEGKGKKRCLQRSTFIIDKQGVLRHACYGVTPRQHAEEMLNRIRELD